MFTPCQKDHKKSKKKGFGIQRNLFHADRYPAITLQSSYGSSRPIEGRYHNLGTLKIMKQL